MTFGVSDTQLKVIRTCSGAMCSLELMPQPSHPHFAPMNECRFPGPCHCRPCPHLPPTDLVHYYQINFTVTFFQQFSFLLKILQGVSIVHSMRGNVESKIAQEVESRNCLVNCLAWERRRSTFLRLPNLYQWSQVSHLPCISPKPVLILCLHIFNS